MRYWIREIALLMGVVGVAACGDESPVNVNEDLLVVRAFLFTGEPVTSVEITRAIPIDAELTEPEPVSTANVVLVRNGVEYPLLPTPDAPGLYHDPLEVVEVREGDVFQLIVEFAGQVITAETSVPEPPTGLALSGNVLQVTTPGAGGGRRPGGGFGGGQVSGITVSWDNPNGELHFMVVDNIESDPTPFPETRFQFPQRFVSQPTPEDTGIIAQLSLTHFGTHRVTLYRVNQEYADLYEGRVQDSRDLNEPPSNIRGGLGVFSAFAADFTFFEAVN